ncbi:MAG: sulfatase-like hydrolase/transferase, partial [Planctomycetota bacterium]
SDQLCEYYGLVTHLDEQVGRVLSAIRNSPGANNTIVIYTADHGLAMGSHGLLGKQNVYEQSMSSPLILAGPGVPKGESSDAFTYIHDLYATVCGFADVPVPAGADAVDLGPVMRGVKAGVRETVFLPFQNNQRSINDGRWKLHIYPLINHKLLFDLKNDPHETKNLAEGDNHARQVARMTKIMNGWRKKLGDPYPLSVQNPAPKEPVYDNAKRTLDVWQPRWIREKYFGGRSDPNHGPK